MPLGEFIPGFPAAPAPSHGLFPHAAAAAISPLGSPLPQQQHAPPHPPQAEADDAREHEPHDGQHHPMRSHPENQSGVLAMPAAALVMAEETPGIPVVLVHHEDAHSASARAVADVGARRHVFLPDDGEEQRTRAVHDGDVGETPVLIVLR